MNKNQFILLSVISLISFQLVGQITQGSVHYKVDMNSFVQRILESDTDQMTKNMYANAGKAMDNISFTLRFKNNEAVFKKDKNLSIDGSEGANVMAAILSSQGTYYTDLKEKKQLLVREFQGQTFNVPSALMERKWKLTKERKMIGEFQCYKATMTIETDAGSLPVIAWYTPEIPVSLGPNNYVGNLPGLLLELHDTTISFTCTSINLDPKETYTIDWPQDVKITSAEDYKKAGEEIKTKIKNN